MTVKENGLYDERTFTRFREDQKFKIVSDTELDDKNFRLDGFNAARIHLRGTHRKCLDIVDNLNRDFTGVFINDEGNEVFVNLTPLWDKTSVEWFRDAVQTAKPRTKAIILRPENRERIRLLLTISRACFPKDAKHWGVRPSSDNEK